MQPCLSGFAELQAEGRNAYRPTNSIMGSRRRIARQRLAPVAGKDSPMIKASFELEKETKNTIRYTEKPEAGKPPAIGTIYIQKWAPLIPTPQTITVTVET